MNKLQDCLEEDYWLENMLRLSRQLKHVLHNMLTLLGSFKKIAL